MDTSSFFPSDDQRKGDFESGNFIQLLYLCESDGKEKDLFQIPSLTGSALAKILKCTLQLAYRCKILEGASTGGGPLGKEMKNHKIKFERYDLSTLRRETSLV